MIDWVREWFRKYIAKGTGTEVPDNKSLYDLIALDRLDSSAHGLAALKTLIDNIVDKDAAPVYKVYPETATHVNLPGSTVNWEWTGWVEIMPANTITETFWIVGALFSIETANYANTTQIGIGAAGNESGIFEASSFKYGEQIAFILPTPIKVAANTRVVGRVASNVISAVTTAVRVKVIYATGL